MDAQELRNLQEAYMEVVENQQLDEEKRPLPVGKMDAKAKELKSKFLKSKPGSPEAGKLISRVSQITGTRDSKVVSDSYDLYDIILSHLLDEGYAETPEAAEVIMVNMSEDWMQSIVEELEQLDEISKELEGRVEMERIARTGAAADRALMHRNPQAMRAAEDAAEKERRTRSLLTRRRRKRAGMG